jgi:PAS domain S-box-containing protein
LAHLPYALEQESRFRLKAIVECSDDAIITKGLDGIITSWNAAASRIFGYASEEIVGRSILTLIPAELHQEEREILKRLTAGERIEHYETIRITKAGTRVNISLTVSPIRDEQGRVIGASKVARDISDRLRADELRNRLAAIVESSDDAIVSKDLNGIITSWNRAATRLFGWSAEEIIGRSLLTIIPANLQGEEAEILRKLRAGECIDHYETQRVHKDGHLVEVSLTVSPIWDDKGRVIGASKIARDITERKRLQQALIESDKLAATGRMAATIAHEINNPLEAVTNLAYLLANDRSLNKTARQYAKMLFEETERASQVARQTLAFYREVGQPVAVDIRELLDGVIRLNRARFEKKKIKVRREYTAAKCVFGFPSELRQVFVNLVLNAVDAAAEQGEICLGVSNETSPGGTSFDGTSFSGTSFNGSDERVCVTVSDNGKGIPEAAQQQLFQPFFTTKKNGGNGLGLWISRGIVEKHGGEIKFRNKTQAGESGAVFTVLLPSKGREKRGFSVLESRVGTNTPKMDRAA